MLREGSSALVWDAERLRIATDAAEVALWSWNVDTDEVALDERAHHLWGLPRRNRPITFEDLSVHVHSEDLDGMRAAFQATRAAPGRYEIDFRVQHGGEADGFPPGARAATWAWSTGSCSGFSST